MIVSRVHPGARESVDLEQSGSRDALLEWYRPSSTSWLRINLVTDIGGTTSGSDGTSDSISTRTDRKILGVIRELADVVMVGAHTVRSEGIGVPRTARIAVVTASGDLTGHGFAAEDLDRVVVLCPESAVEGVRGQLAVDVVALPEVGDAISLPAALAALRSRGLTSIVCEGGPSLASSLLEAHLVDELCLTTVPRFANVSSRPSSLAVAGQDDALHLHQLLVAEDDTLFARWVIARP